MMTNKISGVIDIVHGPNKGGFYSFKIKGDDRWFGVGKFPPKQRAGETVEFEFTQNGNFLNADYKSMKSVAGTAAPAPATNVVSMEDRKYKAAKELTKDDYWTRREAADVEDRAYRRQRDLNTQNEIRQQSARNAAIEFLGMALERGLFTVPEVGNKKTSTLRSLKLQLDKITEEFYEDTLRINAKPEAVVADEEEQQGQQRSLGDDF